MGKLLKHLVCVLFIIFVFNLMLHFVFSVSVFCMSAISVPPAVVVLLIVNKMYFLKKTTFVCVRSMVTNGGDY